MAAWGAPGDNLYYNVNTNFKEEVNPFTEEVHLLMFQNVLSPGAQGNYGDNWPYFHMTKYGLECLKQKDILPYDPNKYMNKISNIASVDEWEKFYINQSLLCYNVGAFESSLIMLGLAGEYLAIRLIDSMDAFLLKNEQAERSRFSSKLNGKTKISQRYCEYENSLGNVSKLKDPVGNDKYPQLKTLKPSLDETAKVVYANYLRLTRNEMVHPSQLKMERIEFLIMIAGSLNIVKLSINIWTITVLIHKLNIYPKEQPWCCIFPCIRKLHYNDGVQKSLSGEKTKTLLIPETV